MENVAGTDLVSRAYVFAWNGYPDTYARETSTDHEFDYNCNEDQNTTVAS